MSLNKLPPEVARELLRHVKPRNVPRSNTSNRSNNNSSNTRVLVACVGFLGISATIPYIATNWIGKNLHDSEEPLTASQVRRGPFMNSGSKDAGADPNWKNGTYVYSKDMLDTLKKQPNTENAVDLGPDIGPAVQQQQQKRR